MLISYHIKAELCTLFDKVHKAFINSANAPRLCTFYRLPTIKPPLFAAAGGADAAGGGCCRHGVAAAGRRGDCRGLPAETKGGKDTVWFPCPLLTPQTLLRTRLPSVARLKARGPQGRLLLQGYTLDRSEAFRSGTPPPCTGWPRTVMRGNPRKVNSGHNSVPKSARRTEPSPRNPRFAAHLRCVSAKEGKGSQEGTGNHMVSCPLLPLAVGTAFPAGEHRHSPPPKAAIVHALRGRKAASSGAPLYRRKVYRLPTV